MRIRISTLVPAIADNVGVSRFAAQMRLKLAKKRGDGVSGWNEPSYCGMDYLERIMREHCAKGLHDSNLIDIANIAMMLWNRRNPFGKSYDSASFWEN